MNIDTIIKLRKVSVLHLFLLLFLNVSVFAQTNAEINELHNELNNDNFEKVKQLINDDISLLECPNPRGSTPLVVAAAGGHTDLVIFMVKKGADVNKPNNFGNSPLHYAGWASDYDAFKILHEKGANIKAKNSQEQTPLEYSCMGGEFEILHYCISKGVDIKEECDDGSSLIHWAAYGGNLEIFKYLESQGLDYNAKDADGSPTIFWAASGNGIDILKYLVEYKKVDANIIDDDDICLLHESIESGNYDITKYLLDNGADIKRKLKDNETFLTLAAQNNNPELVKLLIDKGCKVNVFDDFGNTPLITAAGHGNFESVKILIENNAKLEPGICKRESCTNSGQTALHASWRFPEIMEYLIDIGVDVNAIDIDGNTTMHRIPWGDSTKCIDILCKNGANINIQNNKGETPLIKAIKINKPDIVNTFLKHNADISIGDNLGQTPLHYAAIAGYGSIVDVLIKNGADVKAKDKEAKTPAYYAFYYGNKKIAKNLVTHGDSKKNLANSKGDPLNTELNEGEATIWYLNHSGWAVKTKNHFLIFDYWQQTIDPDQACLNNGRINAEELAEQNIIVFSSHIHQDHYSREIFNWRDSNKNIDYVLGFETNDHDDYIYIPPGNDKEVDNVKITAIKSTDSGEGFMVEVDGLTIYHPGDHANRYQEGDSEFTGEIDFLAENSNNIDIAFVPISGCNFRDKIALVNGNNYLVEKLNPSLVLPMHGSNNEHKYQKYAEERNKEGNTSIYSYTLNKGDRVYYKRQSENLGYSKLMIE